MPNQLNIKTGAIFYFQELLYLFCAYSFCEFDKNANSINVSVLIALYIELVWRLSEFAFFVRLLRWAHFFIYGGIIMDALAIQIGLAILETVSLEIGKKGFKRIKRVLTKDLLDKSVLEMTKQRQYKGFDSDELLRVILYKEDIIFQQLNRVIEELDLRTKVRTDGKTITLDVSPKDFNKLGNY